MSNRFVNASYVIGGYGAGTSQDASTGWYVDFNGSNTKRASSETPIQCSGGMLVAKSGYLINCRWLTSLSKETIKTREGYVDLLYKDLSAYPFESKKIVPFGAKYCCLTVKKENDEDFTQSEMQNLYGTAFEFSDYGAADSVFTAAGECAIYQKDIEIRALRQTHPTYTDDQLLDLAIKQASQKGGNTKIVWDGEDIHFSGQVQHECRGFGGIDFGGSKIFMPDYDTDLSVDYPPEIISVFPDTSKDIIATAEDFTRYRTENAQLQNKVFTINDNYSGNADMCLGNRAGFDTVIYYTPTMITMPDGEFYTSHLYLVPSSGNVPCYNVHDYPAVTFEISNGIVMTRDSQKMSCLVKCSRSNVHLCNFTLYGSRQNVNTYHSRYLFSFRKCLDIEIDHIEGLNPIQTSSGYVLELSSVTNAHIHDCHIGDDTKWGVMGCNHLTNGFFERCDLNRWDCHYAQYGTQTIKECNLCWLCYGVGYGSFVVDSCNFMAKAEAGVPAYIHLRGDTIGVYDGNMIVKNCRFLARDAEVGDYIIWRDGTFGTKPSNSMVSGSPERNRIIENCEFPNGCNAIFKVGLSAQADKPMYHNIVYKVRDAVISCVDGIFVAMSAGQVVKEVALDGCAIGDCTTVKDIADCAIKVSNCNLVAVTSNVTLPRLSITGSVFSGDQSVSNFTDYALAGNIASDMASVNKHS